MSAYYIKTDSNGYIWGVAFSDSPLDGYEETQLPVDGLGNDQIYRVVNNEVIATGIPIFPPNNFDVWDEVNGGWIDGRDLQKKKADKWTSIKADRSAQEHGTFSWGGYTFQCDEASQRRIQSAVQRATIDSTMTLDWTLADNSVQNFAAADYLGIGEALAIHVSQTHERGRILRNQIESATTEAELEAIVW